MDAQAFTDLALRVIAREASDADRAALDAELTTQPARREKFEQLRITHDVLRATAPVVEAARAQEPALPAHRVGELRTAVRQHFGPAVKKDVGSTVWAHVLRWVFGGGGLAAAIFAVVIVCFANKTIEVGFYSSDLAKVRGYESLTPQDFASTKLLTFDQDASFDAWQAAPLAWNERAKIWVDNEHDLLYVMHRIRQGQIRTESQLLAPTDAAQREQIKAVVAGLQQ